jgi:CheY-like chemotaxis protein
MMPAPLPQRPTRVLVVDDEESVRTFAERVLRDAGYEVVVAPDGPEALTLAETRPFDMYVIDLMMPHMRGDELARRLRQIDPDVNVLYFTGYSDRLFEDRKVLWEHEAFLEKPVSIKGLREAVSLMLFGYTQQPKRSRPVRIKIPDARVQFANTVADLADLSLTGALIRTNDEVRPGSEWPLVLELSSGAVHLTGRVLRCKSASSVSPGGAARPSQYAVAITFVEPSVRARRALKRTCSKAVEAGS